MDRSIAAVVVVALSLLLCYASSQLLILKLATVHSIVHCTLLFIDRATNWQWLAIQPR